MAKGRVARQPYADSRDTSREGNKSFHGVDSEGPEQRAGSMPGKPPPSGLLSRACSLSSFLDCRSVPCEQPGLSPVSGTAEEWFSGTRAEAEPAAEVLVGTGELCTWLSAPAAAAGLFPACAEGMICCGGCWIIRGPETSTCGATSTVLCMAFLA